MGAGQNEIVERSFLLQNFFACEVNDMLWNICFREYDKRGYLLSLISCKCAKIKTKWRIIRDYLDNCPTGRVREVQYARYGKTFPSMVSDGEQLRFEAPIVAKLPLFEYAKSGSSVAR